MPGNALKERHKMTSARDAAEAWLQGTDDVTREVITLGQKHRDDPGMVKALKDIASERIRDSLAALIERERTMALAEAGVSLSRLATDLTSLREEIADSSGEAHAILNWATDQIEERASEAWSLYHRLAAAIKEQA
jgi:hypothetical protein